MTKKTPLPVLLVPSPIVLIPAAAMLFKIEGWAWGAADFIVIWFLVAGAMLAYKLDAARVLSRAHRVPAGVALATGLILVWINGAVGLIGQRGQSRQSPLWRRARRGTDRRRDRATSALGYGLGLVRDCARAIPRSYLCTDYLA